jgi:hypothetical protein
MSAIRCTGCDAIGESSLATLYCASCYEAIEEDRAVLLKAARQALEFLESIAGYGNGSSAAALRNAIAAAQQLHQADVAQVLAVDSSEDNQ